MNVLSNAAQPGSSAKSQRSMHTPHPVCRAAVWRDSRFARFGARRASALAPRLVVALAGRGLLLLLVGSVCAAGAEPAASGTNRWEQSVAKLEEGLRANPPAPGAVFFLGSSSIVGWNVKKSFPDLPTVNCGFGGSQMADVARYVDRLVIPWKPRVLVVYSGDNDLKAGKSPEQVRDDFRALAEKVHKQLPQTKIVLIGVKPSIARWNLIEKIRATNKLLAACAEHDAQKRIVFVDVEPLMLDAEGRPRADLFKDDGLHLNAEGYALWAKRIAPLLEETPPADSPNK